MIYRSVRIIIQNNTSQLLVVGGAGVMRGDWTEDEQPAPYQSVEPNQTQTWQTESGIVGIGTQGYVRLGTTHGWVNLGWNRPWVGALEANVNFEGPHVGEQVHVDLYQDEEEPMSPVVKFMISTHARHRPTGIGKTIETEGVAEGLVIGREAPARTRALRK